MACLRASCSAVLPKRSAMPARRVMPVATIRPVRDVRVAASQPVDAPSDFDAILADLADKFEKADNKPVIVGYLSASVAAVVFTEWLIHLPGLNVLLGWPIQLLGIFALPALGIRYFLQSGNDVLQDAEGLVKTATKQLPGLDK